MPNLQHISSSKRIKNMNVLSSQPSRHFQKIRLNVTINTMKSWISRKKLLKWETNIFIFTALAARPVHDLLRIKTNTKLHNKNHYINILEYISISLKNNYLSFLHFLLVTYLHFSNNLFIFENFLSWVFLSFS